VLEPARVKLSYQQTYRLFFGPLPSNFTYMTVSNNFVGTALRQGHDPVFVVFPENRTRTGLRPFFQLS